MNITLVQLQKFTLKQPCPLIGLCFFQEFLLLLNHAVCYVFLILHLLQIKFVPQISIPSFRASLCFEPAADGTRSFNLSTRNKRVEESGALDHSAKLVRQVMQ